MESINRDFIGCQFTVSNPRMTVTIEDDPSKFGLYKSLGLDVFEKAKSKNKRKMTFPKHDNDNKGLDKSDSTNVEGEGDSNES